MLHCTACQTAGYKIFQKQQAVQHVKQQAGVHQTNAHLESMSSLVGSDSTSLN